MKKSILNVIACVSLVFSSCLGDNENTYTGADDFAVIKQTDAGVLYATAAVGNVNLTWDGIDKYKKGDAVILSSYHLNSNSFVGSDIIKADYADVSTSYPLAEQLWVDASVADTVSNVNDKIGLTNLTTKVFKQDANWLNDKWLISYAYNKKEGEVFNLKFIYDKDKQELKVGELLPANTVVVDVVINKKGEAIGTSSELKTQNIVVNFSRLRNIVAPLNITTSTLVKIQFRYSKEGTNSIYANSSGLAGELLYFVSK